MSSSKDKIRDWFFNETPKEWQESIDEDIEKIRGQEEASEKEMQTLTKMVKKLAARIENEQAGIDPSTISQIIKALANGRISDDTIEQALPKEKKRKYERFPTVGNPDTRDFQRPVTVSADGTTQSASDEDEDDEFGKGAVPMPRDEPQQPQRYHTYRIVMSRRLFSGLGMAMTKMAKEGRDDRRYVIEHDAQAKDLLIDESDENEQRNALGEGER